MILRLAARLLGVLWVLALALLALGVAAFCLDGLISLGAARPDRLVHLSTVHHRVGDFLHQLGRPGPTALLSLLCGLGAVLAGLLTLVGTVRPARSRVAVLREDDTGSLLARRGVLREMTETLTRRSYHVSAVEAPKLRLARSGHRGRVTIRAKYSPASLPAEVEGAIEAATAPLLDPFSIKQRVKVTLAEPGERGE